MGACPEWEGQRKEKSEESSKPGKVIPTGPAQRVGSGGKGSAQYILYYICLYVGLTASAGNEYNKHISGNILSEVPSS